MIRKPDLPAGNVAGGIAIVLMIIIAGTVLGGCASPFTGNDGHEAAATVTPTPVTTPAATATPTPLPTPTPSPTATPAPTPAPTPVPEEITRTYQWTFDGRSYTATFSVLKSDYDLYVSRTHVRGSDYAGYRIPDDERTSFERIVSQLSDAAGNSGSGDDSAARAVVAFLQSLPGVTAGDTADDDYPKYPVETLIDGGGDSEDMSILAANLLDLMGYDTVLLGFPGHMAVGLQSDEDRSGRYYPYEGARYYYQEIMPPQRGLGDIPDAYRNTSAALYTMRAGVRLSMDVSEESADDLFVYYHVSCNVKNGGPEAAQNVSVYFAALALDYGEDRVWPFETDVSIGDIPAGESRTAEATVKVPRSGPSQLECIASGDNFDPVTAKGEQFRL